jgi:hypothetical protein
MRRTLEEPEWVRSTRQELQTPGVSRIDREALESLRHCRDRDPAAAEPRSRHPCRFTDTIFSIRLGKSGLC